MKSPRRILVIPCHPIHRWNKSRPVEMIRTMAGMPEVSVFVLNWLGELTVRSRLLKTVVRGCRTAACALSGIRCRKEDGATWVRAPVAVMPPLAFYGHNQRVLRRVIEALNIHTVINEAADFFPFPRDVKGVRYVYDVVDDVLSEGVALASRRAREFVEREIAKADETWGVTEALCGVLRGKAAGAVKWVPNGVDVAAYRREDAARAEALRRRHGLEGCSVVSFIGYHGAWAGLGFLLDAFALLARNKDSVRLLVVGPVADGRAAKAGRAMPSVIFTGPVPQSEIVGYFQISDVGVLPFELSPYTHHALPLKVLEYGAARRPVVAAPLEGLRRIGFPHVRLVEREESRWAEELERLLTPGTWPAQWDEFLDRFAWERIVPAALAEGGEA
jgi:glycosyltransferase involved in cell wall biosynthesis